MDHNLTVVTLPQGELAVRCAMLRKTLAQLPPGATLYVSGPPDLPEVLGQLAAPDLTPWHLLAGPSGIEAWARRREI